MPLVGIAIMPGNIYIVQLKKRKNSFTLLRTCHEVLPMEIYKNGRIIGFDKLSECLRKVVQRERLTGMQAAACLSADLALIQRMRMPVGLSREEVAEEIAVEVQRHAQTRREKLTMDFQILPHLLPEQLEVMFAVTEEEYVWKYQACVEAAGLQLAVMDLDAFALQRALSSGIEQSAMLFMADNAAFFAVFEEDEGLVYRRWDERQASLEVWLSQCATLCQQLMIARLLMCVDGEKIREVITTIFAAVAITAIEVATEQRESLAELKNHHSAMILAYGLAMRSPLPWLK